MEYNDMLQLIGQLEKENKELVAITADYILVYWASVQQFVSWKYGYSLDHNVYFFVSGNYYSDRTREAAIAKFSERIK